MNGFDYDEEDSEIQFTFIGTGSYFGGLFPMIILILLIGVFMATCINFF